MKTMESACNQEDLYRPDPSPVDSLIPVVVVMGIFSPPAILFEAGLPESCCEYIRKKVIFGTFLGCGDRMVMSPELLSLVCQRSAEVLLDLVKKGYLFRDLVRREQWCFCDPTAVWRMKDMRIRR